VLRSVLEPVVTHWPARLNVWLVRKARGYIEKANVPLPARLETWNFLLRKGTAEVLHSDFRSVADERDTFRKMQELWDTTPSDHTLHRMLFYDWQNTLADNDLRKVETMCDLAGVRVSYPMLHPDVVAMSLKVPPDMMMPGRRLRDFYKRATTGFLPDEIIHKKKHGFGLPFGLWLQQTPRLREQIDGNLSALRQRRVIRPEFIDRLLHLHGQEDAGYYGVFIWVLAMLEQWFQEHDVSP
jgi:asparagine synthase (glutamine-hydrolysing)